MQYKRSSMLSVLGWDSKHVEFLIFRAPSCLRKHVTPLVPVVISNNDGRLDFNKSKNCVPPTRTRQACKTENEKGVPEWAIVELQGLVQMKEGADGPSVVGDLHYYSKNKHPVLVLGHHVLNGKETKLDQPMAVIEKMNINDKTEYKIKAIVKKKLLFKSRPKPIISNVIDRL